MSNKTINQLTALDEVTAGDLLVVYSTSNGDARKAALSVIAAYLADTVIVADNKETQYASPSATGFTVTITPVTDGASVWLLLTATGTFATGTIALPASGDAVDRQEVLVNSTQVVTTLTVSATGLTVTGAPTTLAANAFFRMRYDAVNTTWYRVG